MSGNQYVLKLFFFYYYCFVFITQKLLLLYFSSAQINRKKNQCGTIFIKALQCL